MKRDNISDSMGTMLRGAEFRQPDTEARFVAYHMPMIQRELRSSILIAAAFYFSFTFSDIAGLGWGVAAGQLFMARLLVVVAAVAGVLAAARHPDSIRVARAMTSMVEVLAMATFIFITAVRANELAWHATGLVIMLTVIYTHIPNRFVYTVAICWCASIGFVAVAFAYAHLEAREMVTLVMLVVVLNIFSMLEALRYQRVWRRQFHAQEVLHEQSVRDHLTGCYNRRHLHHHLLQHELERARRYRLCLTIILCDIDHFKAINDTYGHAAGDAVLSAFAKVLLLGTRDGIDAVVRYGGEEFLLVLPETDLASGVCVAERLRSAATVPVLFEGQAISASASFGVVALDYGAAPCALTEYDIIARADELMYASKNAGRNRVSSQSLSATGT